MAVLRVGHLGICVRDLERSVAFYRDALGFRPQTEVHVADAASARLLRLPEVDQRTVFLERDNLRLALFAFAKPETEHDPAPRPMNRTGFAALMLRVDDLDATVAACVAAGATVLEETRTEHPTYSSKLVFLTDPDGTLIELIEIPGDPSTPFGAPYLGP